MKAQARSNPRGRVGTNSYPRSYCQLILLRVGVVSSFKSIALPKSTALQWKTTYPGMYEEHKLDLMGGNKGYKVGQTLKED